MRAILGSASSNPFIQLCISVAIEMAQFDYEATRRVANILKNLCLTKEYVLNWMDHTNTLIFPLLSKN